MAVQATFEKLTAKMNTDPTAIEQLSYVYQFDLSGSESGTYQLKIDQGEATYTSGIKWEPRLTLKLSDDHFIKLANDDLNPTMAYMNGKLKVEGDISHALKFHQLLKKYQDD